MKNLAGKYAIITGAGKGLGAAMAKRFLEEDIAGLAMLDLDFDLVSKTAAELDPSGEKTIAVKCNVADADMVKEAIDTVVAKFGRIDILVNNALPPMKGFCPRAAAARSAPSAR